MSQQTASYSAHLTYPASGLQFETSVAPPTRRLTDSPPVLRTRRERTKSSTPAVSVEVGHSSWETEPETRLT